MATAAQTPGRAWLAWFVAQPQERCPRCGWWNETGTLAGWAANCWHARAAIAKAEGRS